MSSLEVEGVSKLYDRKRAVDQVSFRVEPGEIFGLLGPNGAGKTSLIRMIMDIMRPDEGRIRLLGEPMSERLKDRLAYLPEDRGLYQKQKVLDVLTFLGEIKGLTRHVARLRSEKYLDRVGLLEVRKKRMRELSKGMQQKVQLAGVLLHEPELVILDEPFSGLDPLSRALIIEVMKETAARGATVVLSTHLMDQVQALCTRILLINQGRDVLSGKVRDLQEKHSDPAVWIGTDAALEGRADVERVEAGLRDGLAKVHLRIAPDKFLAALVTEGRTIHHFERALPTLDELFIRMTRAAS